MPTKIMTRLLAGTALSALLTGVSFAAEARPYDIPQQDAATALQAFAMQSGKQVLFPYEAVKGKQAPQIKGDYSDAEVIALLAGSAGLRVTADDGRTVTLRPQSAAAEGEGGADAGTVQALVVTAQKREENIQDVPIAMSAFTQEDLTKSQIAGGPDLMTQIPNFTFTKTNFTSYSIQIRGIGTQAISATTDPAVAVAFNNTPFLRSHFFEQEFYDLARVEVLRGPQGTLYGRNATAGVVNVISAKPTFHFEAKASADVGNYSSTRLEGMLNLPLVEDKAALRIAGAWTKRDGYDTNQLTGHPIDGRDLWSTRVSLRIDPTERLRTNFIWEHFKEDDDRLRSGKQTCKTDHSPTEVNGVLVSSADTLAGQALQYPERYLSQGCLPASVYSPDAFQVPDGQTLPYYLPLQSILAPIQGGWGHFDVYASTVQSHDLRVIESQVDPKYRANSDTIELNVDFDVTPSMTFTSQTGFNHDDLWSMEDYNRFNTSPGAFAYCDPDLDPQSCQNNANHQLMPDPAGGAHYGIAAGLGTLEGLPCDPNTPSEWRCNLDGVFCDPQIGCSDRLIVLDVSEERSRQFSQEFRLASNFEGPFNFSVGANFLRYKTQENYLVFINTITLTAAGPGFGYGSSTRWVPGVSDNHECLIDGFDYPDIGATHNPQWNTCAYIDPTPITDLNYQGHNYFLSKNPYKLASYAVFGEGYLTLTPALKLTAGLRWTVDKKHFVDIPSELLVAGYGYPESGQVKQHWSEPTGRLLFDWTPDLSLTDQTLVYGSYVHGYKAGGANPPGAVLLSNRGGDISDPVHPLTFKPEFVNAYELGTKNTLLSGGLTFNLNGFYYDYKGYQISEIVDRSAINMNFDAKIWGAELETSWRPAENMQLGLKVGYEDTRVADGMKAVDLMDRTAGHTDWMVVKPFVTQASNCILPRYVVAKLIQVQSALGGVGPEVDAACGVAYGGVNQFTGVLHADPVTYLPYVPNPTQTVVYNYDLTGYPGFDPALAPNNGAGFDKNLSGNALPNAPHWTTTLTADYTLPLPDSWLVTLHGDFYYQSEAWTRVFNDPGYDKLKAYNNVNLAAIFSNEERGWTVMAYVKNVFDRDNITGAFLNSDDTGLTTNVFLNEPRLYGLRVTKAWTDSPWWTAHAHTPGTPYPFRVELEGYTGKVGHGHDYFQPADAIYYDSDLPFPYSPQNALAMANGGGVRLSYAPTSSWWTLSAAVRYGRAGGHAGAHGAKNLPVTCFINDKYCAIDVSKSDLFSRGTRDYFDVTAGDEESHVFADFSVGHEVGLGSRLSAALTAGLGYARLESASDAVLRGQPDYYVPPNAFGLTPTGLVRYARHFHEFNDEYRANRQFEGVGPVVSVDLQWPLIELADQRGRVGLDMGLGGAVLFGKQTAAIHDHLRGTYRQNFYGYAQYRRTDITPPYDTRLDAKRSTEATVPVVRAELGLSYAVDGLKVSGGYRMERYYKAIDGGVEQRKTYDRSFDGPYVKISIGFGG
ncbi:MAG: TonB-dependent receptor domain-containing protein [Parcubacteria group bacterium]